MSTGGTFTTGVASRLTLGTMVDRKWDKGKSIVNGQHMRAMRYQMDSEYQAYLRHQEQEREQAERLRQKQAASRHSSQHGTSIYSARSYNKPWQTGMTTKEKIPVKLEDKNGHMERQYTSTVSKLPSIKKNNEPIRNKSVLYSSTLNIIQKSNTVERKRVHARQPSSKPNVKHFRDAKGKNDREFKWQDKSNNPKKEDKIQKHRFTEQEKTTTNENQPSNLEENMRSPNNQVLTISTSSPELNRDLQTNSEPMDLRLSPIQTSDNSCIGVPGINTEDIENNAESSINYDQYENESLSDSVSSVSLPLSPASDGEQRTEHNDWRNSLLELGEESSSDSETEEFPVIHRINHDIHAETTRNRLDITSSLRNSYNLPPITSPRSVELRTSLPQVAENSQNSGPVSFLNLRDMIELRRIGVAIAPQTQEHNRSSLVEETVLPLDNNSNTRNVQNHHSLPQTTFRSEESRNRTTPCDETSSNSHVPSLGPSMASAAPSISILHDNLDLIIHTVSMQRQSERIISMASDHVKPTPDPEKLKKIQESLLEEDSEDEGDLCRICLTGDDTTENQLLAPCRCTGSLKYVHKECMKKWLLSKIKSGAELSAVKTCEMCKQNVECNFEEFNVDEHYRRHQQTQATLNPSVYLVLLLHLYQQRYDELLRLSNTRDRVNEISRRFSNLSLGRHELPREDNQET
ncbi:probable E3 ubiquitin-protein ligase MARCHF10 isoform X2 [Pyxicephalus adspersus]|uniref:RING-type E3 ubiquitin transferase n=1 Tax=Pyxicephalus adspersus TaxID=30357 RepID=A0AAV3A6C3_PYXAD|nr:TPA: hypothetical protein GDO54_013238 [Pyxicephalus adspersus]